MDIYKEIVSLEKKGIFICFVYDHYPTGTNCNFSIEFTDRLPADKSTKFVKGRKEYKTGLYGDNTEFGDTADTMVAAIKIAKWLSKKDNVERYFGGGFGSVTEEGRKKFEEKLAFDKKFGTMVNKLYTENHPFKKIK